jgi:uncharacterized alpha-E superfamily protein
MLLDTSNHNSLKVLVNRARENARGVQDHITKEVWAQVNQMYHLINQPSMLRINAGEALEVMELFTRQCVFYTGIASITMPRGTGWDFMNLGKYLERCFQTILFLQKQLNLLEENQAETNDILYWRYLLLALSGYELHLKTYQNSQQHIYNVLHQVVLNEGFSRSIVYCMVHVSMFLERVTNKEDPEAAHLLRCFGRLYSKVNYMDLNLLNEESLEPFLEEITRDLNHFNTLLGQYFFSYS